MMPMVPLSDHTYQLLQQLAVPFVDNPESVIERLAKAELDRRGKQTDAPEPELQEIVLKPTNPPSLAHTRLLKAHVNGTALEKPNWNKLLRQLHVVAKEKLGSFEALRAASAANIRRGQYSESGFEYVPEAEISVQGIEAKLAWLHALKLAEATDTSLSVEFEWRDKEGAAHPGRQGRMDWSP